MTSLELVTISLFLKFFNLLYFTITLSRRLPYRVRLVLSFSFVFPIPLSQAVYRFDPEVPINKVCPRFLNLGANLLLQLLAVTFSLELEIFVNSCSESLALFHVFQEQVFTSNSKCHRHSFLSSVSKDWELGPIRLSSVYCQNIIPDC